MVHLLVARRWVAAHPEYDCPEYYLGAISPDAIHIRDGNDKSHKNEIHLNNWVSPHPDEVIAYWRAHHTPFDFGYGIHVLTDGQWVPRFRERLKGLLDAEDRLNTTVYYNDTILTDVELFRTDGVGEWMFDRILRAQAPDDHPLLTQREISEWPRLNLPVYYEDHSRRAPVQYVTREYVEAFMDDCQALLNETYRRYRDE